MENLSVEMLGYEGDVEFSTNNGRILIQTPQLNPGNNPSQVAWAFKISFGQQ